MIKKSFVFSHFLIVSALIMGCGNTDTAAEGGTETNYPEGDIEFIVGYGPGGGYSTWAQTLAPYIEEHLPNDTNVVVRHMEGAGSALAANHLQREDPDGYSIGIYNYGGLAATQYTRDDAEYDLTEVTWLGRISEDPAVAVVSDESPYESISDFEELDELIVATEGFSANATITAAVTLAELDMDWSPLNHDGSSEAALSVIRNDAHVNWGSYDSVRSYIDGGEFRPILYYSDESHPDHPDVPIPEDIGLPHINEALNTQRLIGAPPGLPEEIKDILEEAIEKAVNDPGFEEDLEELQYSSEYLNAEDTNTLVQDSMDNYEEFLDIIEGLMQME